MSRMRVVVVVALAVLLAACASSRVVRGPVKVSTPKYGASVAVKRGDTLYRLATGNGISVLDLAMWNDIDPPYTIYPGQRLRLYPRERGASSSGHPSARPPVATTRPPATRPATTPTRPATTPPSSPAPAASGLAWRWPTQGELVGRYADGDPTRQGVDIAGSAGQPVLAAADGVVVYSGSGLVGYGELVIVKHNDAWLSAYGHNRARLVNEGQLVKAGQQIAEMGRTGAARDMLHFEIRYNGKPVDPLRYLPAR